MSYNFSQSEVRIWQAFHDNVNFEPIEIRVIMLAFFNQRKNTF